MKQTLLLFSILLHYIGLSQTLSPEVLATSGDYFSNVNNSLSWTIGECITETYSNSNNILTQGFQQNKFTITTSLDENTNSAISVFIYPNPASAFLNIKTVSASLRKLKVDLFDISGKLVHSEIFQNTVQLNISEYSNSAYILKVYDDDNTLVKIFKLQKTN